MYIMCIMLRLFSALSHRVGSLQISIIIIWAWSAIWTVLTILFGFTRVAVWLGLSGVYRSSEVWVCLVDDNGVCM